MTFEEKIRCTEEEAKALNTTSYELRRQKMQEALRWCDQYQKVCRYCSYSNFICDYVEDDLHDYFNCMYANEKVKLRVDLAIQGRPYFTLCEYTDVLKGIFELSDGIYIQEGTFVRIHSADLQINQRAGYVSHPIRYAYIGYLGQYIYYHFIFMNKQDKVQDLSYKNIDYGELGIICSCEPRDSLRSHGNKHVLLEVVEETPELKKQASLYYYHVNGSSFYYSPGDSVRVVLRTGGGWNDYYKIGYIDEHGLIWTSLDKRNRIPINHEPDIIRPIGETELWEHEGQPTELAKKQQEAIDNYLKHPVKTRLLNRYNKSTILVPGEKFGWFLFIVIMIFITFTQARLAGWIMCTICWIVIRSGMRSNYFKKERL